MIKNQNYGFTKEKLSRGTNSGGIRGFYLTFKSKDEQSEIIKDNFVVKLNNFIDKKSNKVKINLKAIKKILPYNGFYPQQRTMQLAGIFSKNYLIDTNYIKSNNTDFNVVQDFTRDTGLPPESIVYSDEAVFTNRALTILQPLFAPGILFNTIKAGIAMPWHFYKYAPTTLNSTQDRHGLSRQGIYTDESQQSGESLKGIFIEDQIGSSFLIDKLKLNDYELILKKKNEKYYDFIINKVEQNDNIRVIKFSENYRFKFKFNKINREIEYFKIGSEDFFDIVARFHLPCVRAYYQGNNVYMLPSCITAMMTGINIEYKYFAGIRNPVEIINKYMQRGFGIILNTEELRQFKEFNSKLPDDNVCKLIDNIDTSLFGVRNINHKSFQGFTTDYDYLTDTDMDNYYNKDIVNPLKFKTINAQGDINPCIKSFFELYYNS